MLMIGATARNCGKTTFACAIIKKFSRITPVIAIKVSTKRVTDSKHKGKKHCNPTKGFKIIEEHNTKGYKDTSRMLSAGAKKVFRIEVKENYLQQAAKAILKKIGRSTVCVCESNSLRKVIKPGLFLILQKRKSRYYKPSAKAVKKFADKIIVFDGKNFNFPLTRISLTARKWSI